MKTFMTPMSVWVRVKDTSKFYLVKLLILVSILSCEGPIGEIGPDGKISLVNFVNEPSGSNCQNGGLRIESGIDNNGNGVLDQDEITQTKYVCNGLHSLTVVKEEPGGSNCLTGGKKIEVGIDLNGNLELEPNEIKLTKYECYSQVIEYAATGYYGNNILFKEQTEFLTRDNSLVAKISKNGKLKIVIKAKVAGTFWGYVLGTSENWRISIFDTSNFVQTFESIESDKVCDLHMVFDKGEYIIEYYEFDTASPTITKTITVNY